jgi:hypothetical protein
MADEPVRIVATAGPYAGQHIDVTAAEAKKAIAEGWARDPFAEPPEPKELTEEERWEVLQAANRGAARLRGAEEAEDGKKAKETKSLEADKPGNYETRSTPPKSK